ncbi:MAG: type III secretion system chaperone [Roseicyclus sp.]|nr:type III secretion system chaperone [Roseicyclus sp.]
MNCKEFIAALASSTGLSDLAPDANGQAAIVVDGAYTLTFAVETDDYTLSCRVPLMSTADFRGSYADLLEANIDAETTGGGALAIDAAAGDITYVRFIATKGITSAQEVSDVVTSVLQMAAFWQHHLPQLQNEQAHTPASDDSDTVVLQL